MNYNIITYDFFTKHYRRSLTIALNDNENNTNCYNCLYCKQCSFCIDCTNCVNCNHCINCVKCVGLNGADSKRNTNKNDVGNTDSTQQTMLKYGITTQEIERQSEIIRRRLNNDRLIIKRTFPNARDQFIELSKLPNTPEKIRERALQELIDIKIKA